MLDMVTNPKDCFSHVVSHIILLHTNIQVSISKINVFTVDVRNLSHMATFDHPLISFDFPALHSHIISNKVAVVFLTFTTLMSLLNMQMYPYTNMKKFKPPPHMHTNDWCITICMS